MIAALPLTILLSISNIVVPVNPGDVITVAREGVLISDGQNIRMLPHEDPSKGVELTEISTFLKEGFSITTLISWERGYGVAGMKKIKESQVGFVALFNREQKLQKSWETGSEYPVALYRENGLFYVAAIQNVGTRDISLTLKEYDGKGDLLRDLMAPLLYQDLDKNRFGLALTYFRLSTMQDGGFFLLDPYSNTIFKVKNGKVEELPLQIQATQLTPIVSMAAVSSYFQCGNEEYIILLGVRLTKKVVPYLVRIDTKGRMTGSTPMEERAIYILQGIGDEFRGKVFDPNNRAFGIQAFTCQDIQTIFKRR